MIIATAGHVDHGKTSLVRALTGVDTDRLPEEKRRGMSIDLGFAYLPLPCAAASPEPLAFVDIPGHQDFIRNALAGLCAADAALLVVSADDGWMPQALEHLCALELLEVPIAAVALTKVDRVPASRQSRVAEAVAQRVGAAPVLPVCTPRGEGIDALRALLVDRAARWPPREADGDFRLAIDRCFSVPGAGLVVTGTVTAGQLAAGDSVRLLTASVPARVRALRVHGQEAQSCRAGQRVALNLAGTQLRREAIHRGEWVVCGDLQPPQRRFDATLRVHATSPQPLKHWTPVHVHLGAAHATGHVAVLQGTRIEPGDTAPVQLVLEQPLAGAWGDRFLVRDSGARVTLGGGRVIDASPPARGRSRPERQLQLRALETADPQDSFARLVDSTPGGVSLAAFRQSRSLSGAQIQAVLDSTPVKQVTAGGTSVAFSPLRWAELTEAALRRLREAHACDPGTLGPPADRLLQGSGHALPRALTLALADALAAEGCIRKRGTAVCLPTHEPQLAGDDQVLWEKMHPLLESGQVRPPTVFELSYALGEPASRIEHALGRAALCGHVVRVSPRRYYLPQVLAGLATTAQSLAQEAGGSFTAAEFRDRSGLGRNLTIEMLEFFDQWRLTRRVGDRHVLLCAAETVFGSAGC